MGLGFEVFVAEFENGELAGCVPCAGVGCPGAEPDFGEVLIALEFDECFGVVFFGDCPGAFSCEFAVVECGEEDIARVADDVDCFLGAIEQGVLVGEFEVCFDEVGALCVEVGGHFPVDVLDLCGDISGAFRRAIDGGVEHEAEPGVAALWVGGEPYDWWLGAHVWMLWLGLGLGLGGVLGCAPLRPECTVCVFDLAGVGGLVA